MKLKRARQFYQYVLVGPGVILALLVPLQFLLPPNTAQRSLFGKFAESVLLTVEPERECLVLRPDFFLLDDLREFFFRSRVGGTKKNK